MRPLISQRVLGRFLLFCLASLGCLGSSADGQTTIGATIVVDPQDLTVIMDQPEEILVKVRGALSQNVQFNFSNEHDEYVQTKPKSISIDAPLNGYIDRTIAVELIPISPGQFDLVGRVFPFSLIDDTEAFIRVTVANSRAIIVIAEVIGWIYFVAWTISFWPQMIINFRRKSVVGLSFDFLTLNLLGHTLYATFNCALFWNNNIEQEYFVRNERGLNPVLANDVAFSIHASVATLLTVFQCFMYERGEQKVSYITYGILSAYAITIVVSGILVGTETYHWLDFLYNLSYIKLSITLVKYIPQAVLNFQRKSTVGWSIENILLDFTGGMLSMLQMLLNGYNYDDWGSIFGDPTKFGLGLFSVLFDIVFIVQHYVLYRNRTDVKTLQEESSSSASSPGTSKDRSFVLLALLAVIVQADAQDPLVVRLYPQRVTVFVNKSQQFTVHFHGSLKENVTLSFDDGTNSTTNAEISPSSVTVVPTVNNTVDEIKVFNVYGLAAGLLDLIGHIKPKGLIDDKHLFVQLTIAKSNLLIQIATIIGWMYFLAWTWSFWPQIWVNRIRASVVGLSFDYIALNLFGHTLYAAFNCAMYWNTSIQEDYMRRNPRGLIPVLANDVAFSLHATFATTIIVVQCLIYERGQQRVSWTGRTLMTIFSLVVTVMGSLAFVGRTHWLDFFYTLSYIKLAITLIKYVPQALLNYRRKSTVGWSIGNILLDFGGGMLSMVQMVINGYNYDDWASIFGDPTKFGLGLFSVLFDVLFIVQHYILYRNSNYIELTGDNIPTPSDPGSSHLPTSDEPIPEMAT